MLRYRATGADGPFGDPRRAHPGVAMEGYYWRLTCARTGRVVVALCGVNRAADGSSWANVALAAAPGGWVRTAVLEQASADPQLLAVRAVGGGLLVADACGVRVDLGEGARLHARFDDVAGWPRRAFGGLGTAHAVPGLSQYWHPHVLGGTATGRFEVGDLAGPLDGATVYAEKNWGAGGFPDRWWWGQAQGFATRPDACVAFAGGAVRVGPVRTTATALVVRMGDELVRLGDPFTSPVRAEVVPGSWRLRARGPRYGVEVEADAAGGDPHVLPVPVPAERRTVDAAHQHLTGRLRVVVRRRGRVVYADESSLAGLEHGDLGGASPCRR